LKREVQLRAEVDEVLGVPVARSPVLTATAAHVLAACQRVVHRRADAVRVDR
jgi:hypothetical protein